MVDRSDEVSELRIDRRTLPKGVRYYEVEPQIRQVIDIEISRYVTEYRAQVLEDEHGRCYVAEFPQGASRPVQYGIGLKVQAVCLSQFQLLPYERIGDHFAEQMGIAVSAGSVFNFNRQSYEVLASFECWVETKLSAGELMQVDETVINIGGKRHWLHCASTDGLTWFQVHAKRGTEAMEAIGILPNFAGVLCRDHWKPYYRYSRAHALCNAHHPRELQRAWEQDGQGWAKRTADLLERLRPYENDVLHFAVEPDVPFTNNQGENDLRMSKVQQKISGCFRSFEGANIFCRIRSYLSTCRKQGVSASKALFLLFSGKSPDFINEELG